MNTCIHKDKHIEEEVLTRFHQVCLFLQLIRGDEISLSVLAEYRSKSCFWSVQRKRIMTDGGNPFSSVIPRGCASEPLRWGGSYGEDLVKMRILGSGPDLPFQNLGWG